MVIGSNIVSVRGSNIKVLGCCLYTFLSYETNTDPIISEYQRRQQICFKKIVTPHKTRPFHNILVFLFLVDFIFFSSSS